MSQQGDVFEPKFIVAALKALEPGSTADKKRFETKWNESIKKRVESWKKHKDNKDVAESQLQFEAAVVEYVDYLHKRLTVHKNANSYAQEAKLFLKRDVPLLGPRFLPPTYTHIFRREAAPKYVPETAYIKPITVVHSVFYPTELIGKCPQCDSLSVGWDGWNATGARDVYGLQLNERAIGNQLRCKDCKEKHASNKDISYCFATTNRMYWDKWEHWRIPKSIPYFFKRTAVTHELAELIIELRLSSTSAGLAEHIKQLHLTEYQHRLMEYLRHFERVPHTQYLASAPTLQFFSAPTDPKGYNDMPITSDFITDLYLDYSAKTRKVESMQYCKTRGAITISVDNTFKAASKATVVNKDGTRENPMNGGILSALNELSETVSWRFCMSASPSEIKELLMGIMKRLVELGLPKLAAVIVDNCCSVRRFIYEALGEEVAVCLDVFHFLRRYGAVVLGGTKNTFYKEVLASVRDAIIKTTSKNNKGLSTYWNQVEQEEKLTAAYEHWVRQRGVWSAAAPKVHAFQMEHVRKGCLARPDGISVALDGSRIEGSHKGWNSLQRAQPSGIEMYTALAHDHVHRRNIRIGTARIESNKPRGDISLPEFIASLDGSHHVQRNNYISQLFNSLASAPSRSNEGHKLRPILPQISDDEVFGLVQSEHSKTYGGHMVNIQKAEVSVLATHQHPQPEGGPDLDPVMDDDDEAAADEAARNFILQSLNISEDLLYAPLQASSTTLKRKQLDDSNSLGAAGAEDTPPNPKRKRQNACPASPGQTPARVNFPDRFDSGVAELIGTPKNDNDGSDSSSTQTPNPSSKAVIDCAPSEGAIVIDTDVPLPNTSQEAGHKVLRAAYSFIPNIEPFSANPDAAATRPDHPTGTPTISPDVALRRPLPLPEDLKAKGLTRSQLLFSKMTAIDPRELQVGGGHEFFLFMDMRIEHQWTTFSMTQIKWATVTREYNNRLEELSKQKGFEFIRKNPRALKDKLDGIERTIITQIMKNDYLSKSTNTDSFWRKHCEAVPSVRVRVETLTSNGNQPRKDQMCARCGLQMYYEDKKLNHKKSVCSDGVAQTKAMDPTLPEYPQPMKVFKKGKLFNPGNFLLAVHNLYERIIENATLTQKSSTAYDHDKELEDRAFAQMLKERTMVFNDHSYFRLYNCLDFDPEGDKCTSLVTEIDGCRYLRMTVCKYYYY